MVQVMISDGSPGSALSSTGDGSPGSALSSTVQVWITVTDENDNSPVWNTQGKLTVPVLR